MTFAHSVIMNDRRVLPSRGTSKILQYASEGAEAVQYGTPGSKSALNFGFQALSLRSHNAGGFLSAVSLTTAKSKHVIMGGKRSFRSARRFYYTDLLMSS
jgi:hypothetical protein